MMESKAAILRQAFDRTFSEPAQRIVADEENLLMVRAGGDPQAIRLRDVRLISKDPRIIPLPAMERQGLLGVAGVRGELVAVFSLDAVLGYAHVDAPSWIVVSSNDPQLAFAISAFEGHARVKKDAFSPRQETKQKVTASVVVAGAVRPVIDLAEIVNSLRTRGSGDR